MARSITPIKKNLIPVSQMSNINQRIAGAYQQQKGRSGAPKLGFGL